MSENATVLTSENSADFYAQKLGLAANSPIEAETEPVVDEEAQSEPEQAEKEATVTGERKPNPKLEKRFSDITKQRDAAKEEARREREAREELEERYKHLDSNVSQAQPKAADSFTEPQPSQFDDAFEYAKALAEFSAEKALRERDKQDADRRANEERSKMLDSWAQRLEKSKAQLPDFEEMVASSDVAVSDQIRDAIFESDVGPRILYHLAENPELAKSLADMTQARALREIGKLEARFEAKQESGRTQPVAAKSNAPAPINPLRATSAAADVSIDSNGQFHGTYAQWKASRKAGKIR